MTNPDDKSRAGQAPDPAPQSNAPSWIDDVLTTSRAAPAPQAGSAEPQQSSSPRPLEVPELSGEEDLRLPDPAPRRVPLTPPASAPPRAATTVQEPFDADDWIARATGGTAKSPVMPQGAPTTPPAQADPWGDAVRQAQAYVQRQPMAPYQGDAPVSADVAQRKLIAGLLGIFLGWLGAHKFYLGMTGAGLTMLGVQAGVWILAVLLGLLTLGFGLFLTLPLAGLVSSAVGLLGLIEGILYLTKSDADFERDYLIGKKSWL